MRSRLVALAARARVYVNEPLLDRLDDQALAAGRLHFDTRPSASSDDPASREWKVFSQFGEDGIIDFILRHTTRPVVPSFVEFGVEGYRESNTRFLCEEGGWRGLIIDGGCRHLEFAKARRLIAHRGLRCVQAFLTVENINEVISDARFSGEIGLLSVDVDGIDYWLCQSLSVVSPAVVVVEHNPYFGPKAQVTVPYDPGFVRRKKHASGVYYGASISAFSSLWGRRGYRLVAVSPEGLNLFFVKEDYCQPSWGLAPTEAYRSPSFSPAITPDGRPFSELALPDALASAAGLPLVDTASGQTLSVAGLIMRMRE